VVAKVDEPPKVGLSQLPRLGRQAVAIAVEAGDRDTLMALGGSYAELFTLQAAAYLDISSATSARRR
jgi:hypothetical protein